MSELVSDEELMRAYQDGDSLAFEALYRRHASKVYGYLRSKIRDRALADDVFQATFMKFHRTRAKYDPSLPFHPWLFTICKTVMLDALRKGDRNLEDLDPMAIDHAAATETSAETESRLPSLDGLSPTQRMGLELRYGGELSFDEIALRLETTPSNARQIVSRAVRALKRLTSEGKAKA